MKLVTKVDALATTLDELNASIAALKAEIAETELQLKRAGENREIANKEFQLTVADQKATQKIITAALNVLKGFYEKDSNESIEKDEEDLVNKGKVKGETEAKKAETE